MTSTEENKLQAILEKHGLVRDVEHDQFPHPVSAMALGLPVPQSVGGDKERHILGVTIVRLYEKGVYEAKRQAIRDARANGQRDAKFDIEGYVSEGRAYCSEVEKQFSRKTGRIKATGRAVQKFLNSLA